MSTTPIKLTAKHRSALGQVLSAFGDKRFRRSDLAERVYPLTNPRNRSLANEISEKVLREAAAAGQIRREGHIHWIRAGNGRTLINGAVLPESSEVQQLVLSTKCPGKWLAVDLESGEVWRGSEKGWKRSSGNHATPVQALAESAK